MGSRKKLVLASLVSLMMAVAFVIGLMPLHGALQARAASSGPGRIDMVDLLNAVLNLQAGVPATEIAVTFPAEGADFVVPDTSAQVFVNFQASAAGDPSPVAYAINPDLTAGPELNLDMDLPGSAGVAYGFAAPYNSVLDVSSLLGPPTTSLSAYAFANAELLKAADTLLIYSVRSGPTNFDVTTISQDVYDIDKNGLPAPLTAVIGPGQQWRASYLLFMYDAAGSFLDFGMRNMAIANLNEPVKQPYGLGVTVAPEPGVFVTSPTFAQLLAADGNYVNAGEEVFLIATSLVEQAPLWTSALQLAISEVYGVGNSAADIAAWAADVEAVQPPLGRVPWTLTEGRLSPYVEISLLAVDTADDTYREIETLPDTLPVVLELQNLDVDGETPIQMWSYLSWIRDAEPAALDFYFASVMSAAGVYEWDFVDQQTTPLGGSFIAELTSLSIFGAFESAMSIYSIYPTSASTCADPGAVNIVGTFGVDAGTTAEDLEAQFEVFFGDQLANILTAAAAYDDMVGFFVEAPASSVAQVVDVTVVDTTVAANLALLEQAFEYYDIFTLDVSVETLDLGGNPLAPPLDVAGGTVDVVPVEATYLAGDVVSLDATAAANYVFVQWLGDVGDIEDVNDETTTLTFASDVADTCDDLNAQITAQFQYTTPIAEYFLTINVAPADSGEVELDDVAQPLGVELGPFAPGTEVDLNAIAEACYEFDGWDGPVANTAMAETTLVFEGMVATIEVTANFLPVCYNLTVIEDPDEGGDVTVDEDRVPRQYYPGESVTLEAFPNTMAMPAYAFVQWVINETDVTTDNPLVLDFSDFSVREVSVRAVFRQNPVLTILETEGGTVDVTSVPPSVGEIPALPNRMIEFIALTEVTLEAVPGTNFAFVQWEGDIAEVDRFDPIVTFAIEANRTVRAVFTATNFLIMDITPDQSWFFGGVVANVRGTGFMPVSSQLRVFGAPVVPLEVTATDVWFVVPPLPVVPPGQSQLVFVTVSNPPFTEAYSESVNFTYRHYATSGNVTTTAFRYAGMTVNTAVALGADLSLATLLLPPPEQSIGQAYGLVRATTVPGLIEADEITAGAAVSDAWNFGIHLYSPAVMDVGLNTGAAVHSEITDWTYARAETTVPAQLEFTVAGTALDAAAIRNDVMMWSVDTRHNYGSYPALTADTTTLVTPVDEAYQSTIEQLEVTPNVTPDSPALGTTPVTSVVSRLYDLTGFALRTGVLELPAEFVDAMVVDAPGGTVSGPTSGGTQFTIAAPLGGLAWVTVGFAETITETTPASATRLGTVIDNGETEFSAIMEAPEWPTDENTTVDVAVYLNSNLNEPLVIFENAFRYTKVGGGFPCDILLLLLGLLAAIIGLAAGGDSGGGGGGPCFIATAAYGTPMAADIDTLRALRDTYLLESSVGTAFVDAYYRVSPAIASVIAQSPALAAIIRLVLLPVIFASKFLLSLPAVTLLAVGVAMMLARIRRRGKAKA